MMTPRQISEDRGVGSSPHFRHTPLQIIHVIGNFLRIWSVYSMYRYLSQTGASVVVPSVINGVITALYFILWGKGLKSCGPVRAILAEYSGAVLGVLSAALYGRRGHIWKKVKSFPTGCLRNRGHQLVCDADNIDATMVLLYAYNPTTEDQTEEVLGMGEMVVPIIAGILSALRRVIARRVSLKNQLKRRLNAITITSATCFLFPVAMWDFITGSTSGSSVQLPFSTWAFLSTTLFGVILIFYVDSIAEERLHMVFSSPRHLMVAGGCIIVMEIVYKMDFSLPGFIICSLILGFGIYEATALERGKKGSFQESDPLNGVLEDQVQMSPLPT
ncbi:hypothetical protein SADUNF_Sadunf17G0108300 [Salix dunnii]|uniref:Uncharacterized protein n=1 Tax=Salix dunnii TaxID=1413687 RepID=A0A835MHL8_9ROSI|nr:hypothetical protein SADUNF_Sadunf17G0108300 [Salix dunnii]